MAGMLLADQEANVIRIVRPGERELPVQQYWLLNRNKKLLELDLKTPEGKKQVLALIKHRYGDRKLPAWNDVFDCIGCNIEM